jgi:hypothetical protein
MKENLQAFSRAMERKKMKRQSYGTHVLSILAFAVVVAAAPLLAEGIHAPIAMFNDTNTQPEDPSTLTLPSFSSTIGSARTPISGVNGASTANDAWLSYESTEPVLSVGPMVDNKSDNQIFIDAQEDADPVAAQLEQYFPIAKDSKYKYRIDFPNTVGVPYLPWFEYPDGLFCASIVCGTGQWQKGTIEIELTLNESTIDAADKAIVAVSTTDLFSKFYFYRTDLFDIKFRRTLADGKLDVDLLATLPIGEPRWRVARALVSLTTESVAQPMFITVPAGGFEDCVRSVVAINGDGISIPSGRYEIESFLAPNVGLIKTIGKGVSGQVLYTLELIEFSRPNHRHRLIRRDP